MILSIQLRECIIRPALQPLDLWNPDVEELLVGTCAKESNAGNYVMQEEKNGPYTAGGLGIYQEEKATHDDLWKNEITPRAELRGKILNHCNFQLPPDAMELVTNLKYATIMCRIRYLVVPKPIPSAHDIEALAAYWKEYYNTPKGAGTPQEFVDAYKRYVG